MKKLLLLAAVLMSLQSFTAGAATISVNQFVEHPALDAILKGFQDYLKDVN